jgi:hypothetical protein
MERLGAAISPREIVLHPLRNLKRTASNCGSPCLAEVDSLLAAVLIMAPGLPVAKREKQLLRLLIGFSEWTITMGVAELTFRARCDCLNEEQLMPPCLSNPFADDLVDAFASELPGAH